MQNLTIIGAWLERGFVQYQLSNNTTRPGPQATEVTGSTSTSVTYIWDNAIYMIILNQQSGGYSIRPIRTLPSPPPEVKPQAASASQNTTGNASQNRVDYTASGGSGGFIWLWLRALWAFCNKGPGQMTQREAFIFVLPFLPFIIVAVILHSIFGGHEAKVNTNTQDIQAESSIDQVEQSASSADQGNTDVTAGGTEETNGTNDNTSELAASVNSSSTANDQSAAKDNGNTAENNKPNIAQIETPPPFDGGELYNKARAIADSLSPSEAVKKAQDEYTFTNSSATADRENLKTQYIAFLESAATRGEIEAISKLAGIYGSNGDDEVSKYFKDDEKCIGWLKCGAELGDPYSMLSLARCCLNGDHGVQQDSQKALDLAKAAKSAVKSGSSEEVTINIEARRIEDKIRTGQ